jgi:hypothetical protein
VILHAPDSESHDSMLRACEISATLATTDDQHPEKE